VHDPGRPIDDAVRARLREGLAQQSSVSFSENRLMSYNLVAEGELDAFDLTQMIEHFVPAELFPIPHGDPAMNLVVGLGIALPLSQRGAGAQEGLERLVNHLWSVEAKVFDLCSGGELRTDEELAEVVARVG
jgi:hypothetical protein